MPEAPPTVDFTVVGTGAKQAAKQAILDAVTQEHMIIYKDTPTSFGIGVVRGVIRGKFQAENKQWIEEDCIDVQCYRSYTGPAQGLAHKAFQPAWTDPKDQKEIYTYKPTQAQRDHPLTAWVLPEEVVVYNISTLHRRKIPTEVIDALKTRTNGMKM